jgi:hypothetical protein
MASSGMLHRMALVRTDVSEERSYVFLRSMRRLLITANVVPSSPILVPDDSGPMFLRNVGSYDSHTV